ncbi:MAG: FmdB family zinc ribbon protein [Rhodanobacter sp.]
MPIYAFACRACGHAFDRLQKLSDPDPSDCPACGKTELARQVTAPSFRLAGSGWYETDFKKDGDKKRNLAGEAGNTSGADGGAAVAPAATTAAPAPAATGSTAARAAPAAASD